MGQKWENWKFVQKCNKTKHNITCDEKNTFTVWTRENENKNCQVDCAQLKKETDGKKICQYRKQEEISVSKCCDQVQDGHAINQESGVSKQVSMVSQREKLMLYLASLNLNPLTFWKCTLKQAKHIKTTLTEQYKDTRKRQFCRYMWGYVT